MKGIGKKMRQGEKIAEKVWILEQTFNNASKHDSAIDMESIGNLNAFKQDSLEYQRNKMRT